MWEAGCDSLVLHNWLSTANVLVALSFLTGPAASWDLQRVTGGLGHLEGVPNFRSNRLGYPGGTGSGTCQRCLTSSLNKKEKHPKVVGERVM